MTPAAVADLVRAALMVAFWTSLPILAIALIAGVVVNLAQIVTSIQDAGFSAIPRLAVFFAALLALLPWMVSRLTAYTASVLMDLGKYAQ